MRIEDCVPNKPVAESELDGDTHSVREGPQREVRGNQERPGHAERNVGQLKRTYSGTADQGVNTGKERDSKAAFCFEEVESEAMACGAVSVGHCGEEHVIVAVTGSGGRQNFDTTETALGVHDLGRPELVSPR